MRRLGRRRSSVVTSREDIERASVSPLREVVDEASYLRGRAEENLDKRRTDQLDPNPFKDLPSSPWSLAVSALVWPSCVIRMKFGCLWILSFRVP
jgi:hypothetical protein